MLAAFIITMGAHAVYVRAEGNCPAGMYPIGGQGVLGCTPIPQSTQAAPSQPSGHWVSQWGAIASDYDPAIMVLRAGRDHAKMLCSTRFVVVES